MVSSHQLQLHSMILSQEMKEVGEEGKRGGQRRGRGEERGGEEGRREDERRGGEREGGLNRKQDTTWYLCAKIKIATLSRKVKLGWRDRMSLYSPGWPQTRNHLVLISRMQILYVCASSAGSEELTLSFKIQRRLYCMREKNVFCFIR